jgi:hypothetical protein
MAVVTDGAGRLEHDAEKWVRFSENIMLQQ